MAPAPRGSFDETRWTVLDERTLATLTSRARQGDVIGSSRRDRSPASVACGQWAGRGQTLRTLDPWEHVCDIR